MSGKIHHKNLNSLKAASAASAAAIAAKAQGAPSEPVPTETDSVAGGDADAADVEDTPTDVAPQAEPSPTEEPDPNSLSARDERLSSEERAHAQWKGNIGGRILGAGIAAAEFLPANPVGVGAGLIGGGYEALKKLGSGSVSGAACELTRGVVETGLSVLPGFVRPFAREGARSLMRGMGAGNCVPEASDIPDVVDKEFMKGDRLKGQREAIDLEKKQLTAETPQGIATEPPSSGGDEAVVEKAPEQQASVQAPQAQNKALSLTM